MFSSQTEPSALQWGLRTSRGISCHHPQSSLGGCFPGPCSNCDSVEVVPTYHRFRHGGTSLAVAVTGVHHTLGDRDQPDVLGLFPLSLRLDHQLPGTLDCGPCVSTICFGGENLYDSLLRSCGQTEDLAQFICLLSPVKTMPPPFESAPLSYTCPSHSPAPLLHLNGPRGQGQPALKQPVDVSQAHRWVRARTG